MCAENAMEESKMNILTVEDEKEIQNLYNTVLTEEGHRVVSAFSGSDALEKMKKEVFDLVILDLNMPDMHGMEVLKEIRDKINGVSVIIVTAYPSLESSIEAIKTGVCDYIIKPFSPKDLRVVIRRSVEKIRLANENRKLLKELNTKIGQLVKPTDKSTAREGTMTELKKMIKDLERNLSSGEKFK